jgi:hypothetical protein
VSSCRVERGWLSAPLHGVVFDILVERPGDSGLSPMALSPRSSCPVKAGDDTEDEARPHDRRIRGTIGPKTPSNHAQSIQK